MLSYARRLVALALAPLLLSCASSPSRLDPTVVAQLPSQVELTETPFFAQERFQCGPAALATILSGWGLDVSPDTLKPEVYLPDRRGSLTVEMIAAARSYDMITYRLAPQLTAIVAEVAAGNPVLVLQNLGLDWVPMWHYAVVVGYDLNKELLVLRSGTVRRRLTQFSVFERSWERAQHWAAVIVPAGRMPATAEPLKYLRAASALESTGRFQAARASYLAALDRWPQNHVALMGLGNASYQLQDYRQAENAFRQALRHRPQAPEAWNNLAYVLAGKGCLQQARQAAGCAAALQPDEPVYRSSVKELAATERATTAVDSTCVSITCPRVTYEPMETANQQR